MSTRTCTPTLATGVETGDVNAVEIVGGESGVGEEEEIYNELQMHRTGMRGSYGLWKDCENEGRAAT